jgi:hypothetical protein
VTVRRRLMTVAYAAVVLAALFPATGVRAAAAIEFINPSQYRGATTTMQLSDMGDNDAAYHLVAWVQEVPSSPLVEFEIQATGENPQTLNAFRVGSTDTWEAFYEIPDNNTDGPYVLRARLYSGGTEVANDEKTVTINQADVPPPPAAQTVEISYPANGAPFGFFTPKGKATNGVLVTKASEGTRQVVGFYTQSDPGNLAEWESCGSGAPAAMTFVARVRCTLNEGDTPASVTAVAAVANRTPSQAAPNPSLDDSGDAHRVFPYVQQPSRFSFAPQATSADPENCTAVIAGTLLDQQGQPIAQANVDAHAVGPSDQLRFGTITGGSGTSAFQPPDKGHLSSEFAIACADEDNSGTQGEHNVPGGDDVKHVETVATGGTSNAGSFSFALYADETGSTVVTLFADVDDDDVQGASEAAGGARIGWGQAPPPPVTQVSLLPSSPSPTAGRCQKITLVLTEDGAPLSGRNVDVHATGPGDVEFCDAGNGFPRPPDQGGHVNYDHPDGGIHGENETDSSGHFVFGVLSTATGATSLSGWMDRTDDDVPGGDEPNGSGQINWQESGRRSISLNSNKRAVPSGSRVRLSGRIDGDDGCTDAQTVNLKARPSGKRKFKTAGSTTTDSNGSYRFRKRVSRKTTYRAVAPRNGACEKARSGTVTVRAN